MVQPWSFINFGPVVKLFGSTVKKVGFVQVRLGVLMEQHCSIMNFGPVIKPFGSTLKKVALGQVRLTGTALVDHEFWTRR